MMTCPVPLMIRLVGWTLIDFGGCNENAFECSGILASRKMFTLIWGYKEFELFTLHVYPRTAFSRVSRLSLMRILTLLTLG